MINSSLEITENEYLIKLNRSKFDLSFIRSLLKIVEVSGPVIEDDFGDKAILDNGFSSGSNYYGHLDEK